MTAKEQARLSLQILTINAVLEYRVILNNEEFVRAMTKAIDINIKNIDKILTDELANHPSMQYNDILEKQQIMLLNYIFMSNVIAKEMLQRIMKRKLEQEILLDESISPTLRKFFVDNLIESNNWEKFKNETELSYLKEDVPIGRGDVITESGNY